MSKKREKAIQTIRGLRARARDAASSQAEIEAAAAAAAKLMARHDVKESELIERGVAGIGQGRHNRGRARRHDAVRYAMAGICALTQTKGYSAGGEEIYVGDTGDVEFALYLCELTQSTAEREWKEYAKGRNLVGTWRSRARTAFMCYYGSAVSSRLVCLAMQRRDEAKRSATGTDLVAVKGALIDQYAEEEWGQVRQSRQSTRSIADLSAAIAGNRSGDRLNINRPLSEAADDNLVLQEEQAHG